MVSIPYEIGAQSALYRQNMALSMVKHASKMDQMFVKMIDQAARSAPPSRSLGTNVNFRA